MIFLYAIIFAFLNRARGSQFYNLTSSTTAGRLLSTFFMALTSTLPLTGFGHSEHMLELVIPAWLLLYGFTIPAWDAYWSAAIGSDPQHSKLWGVGMMTLRQSLLLPYYSFLVGIEGDWLRLGYSASFLLMGGVYAFWGAVTTKNTIGKAELTNGAIMGITTALILWS